MPRAAEDEEDYTTMAPLANADRCLTLGWDPTIRYGWGADDLSSTILVRSWGPGARDWYRGSDTCE